MAQHQPIRKESSNGSEIPDKLYFRIGEVSRLCDVPSYVLRFWESEFPQLKPHKGGTGQRLYRRRDVETALHIKTLLYEEGYTISGARQVLRAEMRHKEPQLPLAVENAIDVGRVRQLQKDLRDLLMMLSSPSTRSSVQSIRAPRPLRRPRNGAPKNLFESEPL
jgi:DNA-binding transcriptional MerR regulator